MGTLIRRESSHDAIGPKGKSGPLVPAPGWQATRLRKALTRCNANARRHEYPLAGVSLGLVMQVTTHAPVPDSALARLALREIRRLVGEAEARHLEVRKAVPAPEGRLATQMLATSNLHQPILRPWMHVSPRRRTAPRLRDRPAEPRPRGPREGLHRGLSGHFGKVPRS